MFVQGVFSGVPKAPRQDGDGWGDEVSEVIDRPVGDAASDEEGRITSEFPDSIEQAVQVAAETHVPVPRVPARD